MKKTIRNLKKFICGKAGVVAVWFGMFVPLVVTATGISVDIGQSYLMKERLSQALDAAALAAAANSSEDATEVEERVNDFLDANYPPEKIGAVTEVHVESSADTLYVTAEAELQTSFMKVFGTPTVTVDVETEVTKEVKAIEVALVMDVTGSMSTNNNIATLRTAATNFVNTIFDRVEDTDYIKIGLVPFSSSVNVGPYGLGKTPGGLNYDDPFVNNPSNLQYSATNTSRWMGCILEEDYPKDVEDHEGPWDMYRYCRTKMGAVIPGCDTTRSGKKPNYTYTANQNQNYLCPRTPVTPLTNNKTELLNSISTLKADGNTYINVGLVWGERLISPEFPFSEGVTWNDEDWKKAIILMTDGVNTMHNFYSVYGPTADHDITPGDLDDRMLEVCEDLREKNVLVYTITFDAGVDDYTKDLFKECATQPSMWYHAPTQAKLIEVYQTIAKELANLHLSK
jgi:Flp pilus assembly protein TadG